MRTPTARATTVVVLALAATTALAGCARIEQWTGVDAPQPGAAPPTTSPSPTIARPSATPTWSPTALSTATPTSPDPTPSSTPSPSPTTTPTATPTTTPSPKPTATPEPSPKPPPPPARTSLRYGDSGTKVRDLQHRLVELGYWLGPRDGSFGPLTQQAVFALQKSAGLQRDGVVGPRTAQALERGVRPTATLTGNGIEIDLDRQILMVVRGGRPALVLNTSTGNGEPYISTAGNPARAITPRGTFAVFRQVDGQDDSALGELWRPKYFYRGWAVHGSPSIPPYPASHGCARVSNAAMNMMWSEGLMPIGATVRVR